MVDKLVGTEVNARRIGAVESAFGSGGQPLALPGRVLVGEGVLVKMCRKKPKPRQFFLFNDILIYGSILISKTRYNNQHVIPLEEVQLEDLPDDGELKNGWLLKTRTKSFAVYAATASEKKEWMVHIHRCVVDLLAKSGKKPATDHAAVWVPDSEAPLCQKCNKTQFTVIYRRHHCRHCGAVVCGACSGRRFLLPAISRRPVRVCQQCFVLLDAANGGAAAMAPPTVDNNDSSGEEDDSDDDDTTTQQQRSDEVRRPTFYETIPGSPPPADTL